MDNEKSHQTSDRRVGQRFGDYLVEGQIGRGGMGVVFRARHEANGEVVALKLMAPDLADNQSFRERFVREAEAGPNLAHPNIVPVFESGEADGELIDVSCLAVPKGLAAWNPTWAPDGKSVVYTDWSSGEGLLFQSFMDGCGRVQLTSGPNDYTADWWAPAP